jgi:hypothetical protein
MMTLRQSASGDAGEFKCIDTRQQLGGFPLSEIEHACPGVGREWIRPLLSDWKAAGEGSCQGKGPAARWHHLGSKGANS